MAETYQDTIVLVYDLGPISINFERNQSARPSVDRVGSFHQKANVEKKITREDFDRAEAGTKLKVIPLITGIVPTNHHVPTANPIIAGLMVSPVARALPQLTIEYYEVYNGNAISRNTRGLWKP